MAQVLDIIGRIIARYLERPVQGYDLFTPSDPVALRKSLEPGDVLLLEGNSHISRVIKYLTQSTWSHAALCVGPIKGASSNCAPMPCSTSTHKAQNFSNSTNTRVTTAIGPLPPWRTARSPTQ